MHTSERRKPIGAEVSREQIETLITSIRANLALVEGYGKACIRVCEAGKAGHPIEFEHGGIQYSVTSRYENDLKDSERVTFNYLEMIVSLPDGSYDRLNLLTHSAQSPYSSSIEYCRFDNEEDFNRSRPSDKKINTTEAYSKGVDMSAQLLVDSSSELIPHDLESLLHIAGEEARRLNNGSIGTVHVLLALLRTPAAQVIKSPTGEPLSLAEARKTAEYLIGMREATGALKVAPDVKRVFERAEQKAGLGTTLEEILLALLEEEKSRGGNAAVVIQSFTRSQSLDPEITALRGRLRQQS